MKDRIKRWRDDDEALLNADEWLWKTLDAYPPPSVPATEVWEFSIGSVLSRHPKAPAGIEKPLRLLDGLGALRIGPDDIGFDGHNRSWDEVTELRLVDVAKVAVHDVIKSELARYSRVLIGVPGRGWILEQLSHGLSTLAVRYVDRAHSDKFGTAGQRLAPFEFAYRGSLGRQRTRRISVYPMLLGMQGEVIDSLYATAEIHKVPVVRA
ncbi:hypothetical protein [Streptomyces alkaliterrae]|uniref:Uncharacterized protein n=1 Tax=Streptomyces alkaliterrae TaxID=2213162 RepID=A0A5P0YTS1_9ACTN|nr:hypothetical protein [Streptomyces alkaliterrae]MBB1261808.1 hypothetical protein [Streptomyces alkaliterrae]MQS03027.1 hypothetical protein [Streptomyces alkaliterrae]